MGGRGREGERERRRTKGEGGTKVEREGVRRSEVQKESEINHKLPCHGPAACALPGAQLYWASRGAP